MNTEILRSLTSKEVDTYNRDGVLLLENMFDKDWIKILNKGLDVNIEKPTKRSRIWYKDTSGRSMFYDHTAWQNIDEYKKFIFNSPAAKICGRLMDSSIINFFLIQYLFDLLELSLKLLGIKTNLIGQLKVLMLVQFGYL